MKNGNLKVAACCVLVGYILGVLYFKNKNSILNFFTEADKKNINKLKEFFIDDYQNAVKKYVKYLDMGLSSQEAFDTMVSCIDAEFLTIGDIND